MAPWGAAIGWPSRVGDLPMAAFISECRDDCRDTVVCMSRMRERCSALLFAKHMTSTLLRPVYAGRAAGASPATGLAKRHAAEQAALIAAALGHSSRADAVAAQ